LNALVLPYGEDYIKSKYDGIAPNNKNQITSLLKMCHFCRKKYTLLQQMIGTTILRCDCIPPKYVTKCGKLNLLQEPSIDYRTSLTCDALRE
jgi:hypothetical protein